MLSPFKVHLGQATHNRENAVSYPRDKVINEPDTSTTMLVTYARTHSVLIVRPSENREGLDHTVLLDLYAGTVVSTDYDEIWGRQLALQRKAYRDRMNAGPTKPKNGAAGPHPPRHGAQRGSAS